MKKFFAVGCAIIFATITIACSPDEATTPDQDKEPITQEAKNVGINIQVEAPEKSAQEVGVDVKVGGAE